MTNLNPTYRMALYRWLGILETANICIFAAIRSKLNEAGLAKHTVVGYSSEVNEVVYCHYIGSEDQGIKLPTIGLESQIPNQLDNIWMRMDDERLHVFVVLPSDKSHVAFHGWLNQLAIEGNFKVNVGVTVEED